MSECFLFHKWTPWSGDWLGQTPDGLAAILTRRECARCGKVQEKVKLVLGDK